MSHPTHPDAEPPIPRGIEVLVKKAAVDAGFRRLLLAERAKAAERIGLKLDASERMMLSAVPDKQIEAIIDRTTVPVEQRRAFLGKAAAAMLAALSAGGAAVAAAGGFGVSKGGAGGIMPDRPMPAPTGSRPDFPGPFEPPREPSVARPRRETESRVIAVVAGRTGVARDKISANTRFYADLKVEGPKRVAIRRALEKEFGVVLSPDVFGELMDVGSTAAHVEAVAAVSSEAIETVARQLRVDRGRLSGETTLDGDLEVTRLDRAQLRRRLATQFRVYLDWDEFKELKTVGDVIDQVARQVEKRNEAAAEKQSEPHRPTSPVSRGSRPDRPKPKSFGIQPDLPHGSSGFGGVRPD